MDQFAIKILHEDDDSATIGGYGVVFGGHDLEGETFTPETDYDLGLVPHKPLLYDHSYNDKIGAKRLGIVKAIDPREAGLWIEAELQKHEAYVSEVLKLVEAGALGLSSGSVAHLTRREGGVIKSWPIVEFSLTATPAEPRTIGVQRLKALINEHPAMADLLPKDATESVGEEKAAEEINHSREENEMSEQKPEAVEHISRDEFKAFQGDVTEQLKGINSLNDAVAALLERVENSAPLKDGGYVAPDDEQPNGVKSFGDYLLAVKRGNVRRLASVYGATKDMLEGAGGQGGYLVPEEYANQLLQFSPETSPIVSRVNRIPVNLPSGYYPALDVFAAPTAGGGETAMSGGVTSTQTAEAGALTETQATFEQLAWRVYKVGGYTEVSNELIADSPQSIEALLSSLFRIAINSKLEFYILRGTGAGQPLGILNSTAAVAVTTAADNAFGEADALGMLARFKRFQSEPVWIMHRGVLPDFKDFTSSGADLVEWRQVMQGSLLGYQIVFSEHSPQDDNAGDVILADLGAYLLFERQGLEIAFSEHAKFTNDMGTWRFYGRWDGMPWLKSTITLADPQGSYTVSPFVYHND